MADLPKAPLRPSVLSLSITSRSALYAAFIPVLKNGGLFVSSPRKYNLGDEIFMLLTLMDDPTKLPVAGNVAWITPEGAQNGRTQGIGVHFKPDEGGQEIRRKIEGLLGSAIQSSRATHTL